MTPPPTSKLNAFAQHTLRHDVAPVAPGLLAHRLTWRVLAMRPAWRAAILAAAAASATCGLAGPYFQKLFVDGLLARSAEGGGELRPFLEWIAAAFAALLGSQALAALTRLLCVREGALVNRFLSRALYEHVLHLSSASRRTSTVGAFVSHYSQDVASAASLVDELLPMLAMSAIPFIITPLAVGLYFSLPAAPLAAVTAGSLAILLGMSVRQSRFFANFKRLAAERLGVVNEWLQNIRIIRILGWTDSFEARIFATRIRETDNRLGMVTNGSSMNAFAQAAPGLLTATGIASVVLANVTPTAGEIFALLWVLSVFMARPLRSVPWCVVMFLDGKTSCTRLAKVFALPREGAPVTAPAPATAAAPTSPWALDARGIDLTIDGKRLLAGIDLKLKRGELVAVVGEVGAGKSLLIDALLREAPARFASYALDGQDALSLSVDALRAHFAFVPQDGFVMSASLRDNVVLEYDASRTGDATVARSLALSAFDPATESLTAGLETELGERGVNLSGGQRQRVSLGRAHFAGRSIVLLDDCLSAVDVDTERRLMRDLIDGAWRGSTRLLVTHRLAVLPRADRVILMAKGAIVAEGRFDELMATSERFREVARAMAGAAAQEAT